MTKDTNQSAAVAAYAAALVEIERVRAERGTVLYLFDTRFKYLDRIPPEIAGIGSLKILDLDKTQVRDLTLIKALHKLRFLSLDQTQVSNLTPVLALSRLENLNLNRTRIDNIKPALLMAWIPLRTASQFAIVVGVRAITKGRRFHVRSYDYRCRPGTARFPVTRCPQ